ncbi:hypothetical protein M422DRAFT_52803 [Sphaerobolus stellatus SS14]|uniref:Uncharacterized protein n=1 Tax=Sphaerobolus stellatus (strain SS14) TaxID=990650 RepID=A0A0C9TQW7_SPHS4|nr:hypothetical protein M422DRAFT_52803 [Sphaerobolus stellatus SS14]
MRQARKELSMRAQWFALRGVTIAGFAVSTDYLDPLSHTLNFTFAGNDTARRFFDDEELNMTQIIYDFETFCRDGELKERWKGGHDTDPLTALRNAMETKSGDKRKSAISEMLRRIWKNATGMQAPRLRWDEWADDFIKKQCRLVGWPAEVTWPSGPAPYGSIDRGKSGKLLGEALLAPEGRKIRVEPWTEDEIKLADSAPRHRLNKDPAWLSISIIIDQEGNPLLTIGQINDQATARAKYSKGKKTGESVKQEGSASEKDDTASQESADEEPKKKKEVPKEGRGKKVKESKRKRKRDVEENGKGRGRKRGKKEPKSRATCNDSDAEAESSEAAETSKPSKKPKPQAVVQQNDVAERDASNISSDQESDEDKRGSDGHRLELVGGGGTSRYCLNRAGGLPVGDTGFRAAEPDPVGGLYDPVHSAGGRAVEFANPWVNTTQALGGVGYVGVAPPLDSGGAASIAGGASAYAGHAAYPRAMSRPPLRAQSRPPSRGDVAPPPGVMPVPGSFERPSSLGVYPHAQPIQGVVLHRHRARSHSVEPQPHAFGTNSEARHYPQLGPTMRLPQATLPEAVSRHDVLVKFLSLTVILEVLTYGYGQHGQGYQAQAQGYGGDRRGYGPLGGYYPPAHEVQGRDGRQGYTNTAGYGHVQGGYDYVPGVQQRHPMPAVQEESDYSYRHR